MFRSPIDKTFIGLTLFISALNAFAQGTDEALATVGDNSEEPSGWMRIEVAIFVDTRSDALTAELWEINPSLVYPTNKRWLTDYNEIKMLMDKWGEDAVSIETNGSIAIVPEPVVPPEPEPEPEADADNTLSGEIDLDGRLSEASLEESLLSSQLLGEGDPSLTLSTVDRPTTGGSGIPNPEQQEGLALTTADQFDTAPLEPGEKGTEAINPVRTESSLQNASQVALETLGASEDNLDAGVNSAISEGLEPTTVMDDASSDAKKVDEDALLASDNGNESSQETGDFFAIEGLGEDFNGLVTNSERPVSSLIGDADNNGIDWLSDFETEESEDGGDLTVEPTPPPMPASYQLMPVEMLNAGLRQLEKDTGRRATAVLSWLQTVSTGSDAVIVDSWTANSATPDIQGTVQITTPSASSREFQLSTHIWANTHANYLPKKLPGLPLPSAPTRILLVEPEAPMRQGVEEPVVEFIDITTGLNALRPLPDETQSEQGLTEGKDPSAEQSFKHAITLRDVRDLREGYVRYIDHPVIQVAAVWRELSYAELYELGEAQRVRRDIDSLTRSLTTSTSTPSPESEMPITQPAP